ncbi:MAG: RNA pyrophosphohydrolase [Hyphomicrobiaceae bacterium]
MSDSTTSSTDRELPFRPSVGIMLVNHHGLIWIGCRRPKWAEIGTEVWQMPQGGMLDGEPPEVAAVRELQEETSVRSAVVIGSIREPLTYELPPELIGVALKGKFRGQIQRWFALRFLGEDREIDIAGRDGKKAEFDTWKWATFEQLLELTPDYRRSLYERVGHGLLPLVRN